MVAWHFGRGQLADPGKHPWPAVVMVVPQKETLDIADAASSG
jgi:hypothetical protein